LDYISNERSVKYPCDFTDTGSVEWVYSNIPYINVLINTMGHVENNLIKNMAEQEWDDVIASNLKTVFLSCRYAYDKMVSGSHIINISSVLGKMGMPGASNYVAAKGAVEAFTKFCIGVYYEKGCVCKCNITWVFQHRTRFGPNTKNSRTDDGENPFEMFWRTG
jgi:NADP-dependent 3-hydroxy acid dehydrogenase YdfG